MTPHTAPDRPFAKEQQAPFRGRAFGSAPADLAVDFGRVARPFVISEVLSNCLSRLDGSPFDDDEIWAWSTARRLQGLLAVVVRTQGPALELGATCPRPGCGELLELPLRLAYFEQAAVPPALRCRPADGVELELRMPAGSDQRSWLEEGSIDAAPATLARTLVTRVNDAPPEPAWQIDPAWLDTIENTLAEADPLNDIRLETRCPHCGRSFDVHLDLELELLGALRRRQPALLDDVHRIASAYHWTETQILTLSQERRSEYLARIDGAAHG